jgi:pyruvate/2-oxoglutarate dehydrogenase complex dihydrolipoamide acyltransferase (E2) component
MLSVGVGQEENTMNIDYEKKQNLTSYRKIAIASWRHPRDPSTFAMLDLPVEEAMKFLKETPSDTPLTMTHFVAKILAHCLTKYSELNHVLRFGNLYKRKTADIFITTLLKGKKGKDLSGFVIRDVDAKPISDIAAFSATRTLELRNNNDEENRRVQQIVNPVHSLILRPILLLQEFLQFTLNISIPFLGMPKDRFGSAMITNIGALGFENAFIPLSPYSRCPLLVGVGKPRQMPIVQNDKVVVADVITITFTFDHRHADGAHGSHVLRRFKKLFLDPFAFRSVFENARAQQSN